MINRLIKWYTSRNDPDLTVNNGHRGVPYLRRWWIIPKNRWFNVYLHCFTRSDDDRALHDHPWCSLSFLLKGEVFEHHFNGKRHVWRFLPVFRSHLFAHRIQVIKGPVWTLFITGPEVRDWGFYTDNGWIKAQEYFELYGIQS